MLIFCLNVVRISWIVLFYFCSSYDSLTTSWGILGSRIESSSHLNAFLYPFYWRLLASGFIGLLSILLTGSVLRFSEILARSSRTIWLVNWHFLQVTLAWDCFTLKRFSLIDIWDRLKLFLRGGCGARVIVFDIFLLDRGGGSDGASEMVPVIYIIAFAGGRKDLDFQFRYIL